LPFMFVFPKLISSFGGSAPFVTVAYMELIKSGVADSSFILSSYCGFLFESLFASPERLMFISFFSDDIFNVFMFMLLSEPVNLVFNSNMLFMWLSRGMMGVNSFIVSLLLCSSPEKDSFLPVVFSGNCICIPLDDILLAAVDIFRRLMCAFSFVAFILALSRLTARPELSLKAIFLM